ncbi:response regulator [Cellulophaga sp. HaHaR_3_176]|uniref:response regulator n=1 Tax=Cellulophaga sp. HaHaR_3_176 TaxID=1942464 RepID=UPI001C1FB956|nr:response regulator [Cellulophaga sp. HaHaR_3_176]QWX85314.1 response regulator [Cellulophaga sp. HaHaR_3_176]
MKSNELLTYINDLESKLNSFSFEELTSDQASSLKKSFQSFKENLKGKKELKPNELNSGGIKKIDLNSIESKPFNKKDKQDLLLSNLSNELRTPLNAILNSADLLAEEKLTTLQNTYVNDIKSVSNTLLNIINELSEFSKRSLGNVSFEAIEFNFHNVLKEVIFLLKTLIVNEGVTLNIFISDEIPKIVIGDPSKLFQIILNLVGNAIKVTNKGTVDVNVSLESNVKSHVFLNFKIKDTGLGMSQNQLDDIFNYEPKIIKNNHENHERSDLELGIIKNIIEHLGGNITVKSKIGVGTEFNFSIPYSIIEHIEIENKKGSQNQNPKRKLLENLKVLVFEDSVLSQKLIKNRLDNWGCNVFITDNENDGLLILKNESIELIIMDLHLTNTTGFNISKKIRNNSSKEIRSVPIIALTADFTVKDSDLCLESGINDYLLKPFNPEELFRKIRLNTNKLNNNIAMKTQPIVSKIDHLYIDEIDLEPVLEECFGDLEMLEQLVVLFKSNAIEFIGKTKVDLKSENIEGIRFNAHKLKSGLNMMQTPSLHKIVEQMHKICLEDKDIKYLRFLYDCFLNEYPAVEKAIDLAMDTYKNK